MTVRQNIDDDKYTILKHFGTVSEKLRGKFIFRKELNLISYNDGNPVYDLRTWKIEKLNRTNVVRGDGFTMTEADIKILAKIIDQGIAMTKSDIKRLAEIIDQEGLVNE